MYGAKIPVATTDYRISRDIQTRYRMNIPIILDSFEKEALDYIQQNDKHATIDINNLWDLEQITDYSAGITRRSYSVVTANKKVENLLESIFIMAEEIGLVEAVRMGTYNPAKRGNRRRQNSRSHCRRRTRPYTGQCDDRQQRSNYFEYELEKINKCIY